MIHAAYAAGAGFVTAAGQAEGGGHGESGQATLNGCVLTIKILLRSRMVWDKSVLADLPEHSVGANWSPVMRVSRGR